MTQLVESVRLGRPGPVFALSHFLLAYETGNREESAVQSHVRASLSRDVIITSRECLSVPPPMFPAVLVTAVFDDGLKSKPNISQLGDANRPVCHSRQTKAFALFDENCKIKLKYGN